MLKHNFVKTGIVVATMASALVLSQASNAALTYSNDFEGFVSGDVGDGWTIGNIVNGGAWWGGSVAAPGDYNNGYSAIVSEGGAAQGTQQLSIFNDYNPWSPFGDGTQGIEVQAFVYKDVGFIGLDDVGTTLTFSFDAKLGNLAAPSQADAFIKVLDSVGGSYAEFVLVEFDSDASLTTGWSEGLSLSFDVDASLVGQLVQIGFTNTAVDYGATGVVYDNLNVGVAAVPVPAAAWLFGSALLGLMGISRRRAS